MIRRWFLIGACVLFIGTLISARPAAAAADPAAVVISLGNHALEVLGNNVDPKLRVARFRQLFSEDFDVPGIARFVLGRYWRVATEPQQQEFVKLFADYIALAYSNRLAEYSGETLHVTGTRPAPDGSVVSSEIVRPNGAPPAKVDWVLTKADCASARYGGHWDAIKGVCHPIKTDCFAWAEFWAGGLTYYGGFIGASVGAFYLLRRDRFPFWKAADMAGFTVPLGLAFGRMGCLLAGCCFGVRTDEPWALSFPVHSPASESQWKLHLLPSMAVQSLPVHPTQVYESAASLAISAVCMLVIHPRKRYDGQVFASFVALYAAARFILEFWRDDDRGGFAHLSTSQLLGIALVAFALGIHVVKGRRATVQPLPA